MQQPHYAPETAILHQLAADPNCRFQWTNHAIKQMEQRGILAEDVIHALTHGQIVFHEIKQDTLYRVDGKDLDGQRLQVQVAIYEEILSIKVITAF
jgi:hypothetical protein